MGGLTAAFGEALEFGEKALEVGAAVGMINAVSNIVSDRPDTKPQQLAM